MENIEILLCEEGQDILLLYMYYYDHEVRQNI